MPRDLPFTIKRKLSDEHKQAISDYKKGWWSEKKARLAKVREEELSQELDDEEQAFPDSEAPGNTFSE